MSLIPAAVGKDFSRSHTNPPDPVDAFKRKSARFKSLLPSVVDSGGRSLVATGRRENTSTCNRGIFNGLTLKHIGRIFCGFNYGLCNDYDLY